MVWRDSAPPPPDAGAARACALEFSRVSASGEPLIRSGFDVYRVGLAIPGSAGVPPAEPRLGAAYPHPILLP